MWSAHWNTKQSSHLSSLLSLVLLCQLNLPLVYLLHQELFIHHFVSHLVLVVLSHIAEQVQQY